MTRLNAFLRRVDPGFFVVLVIAFLAIWPFVSRPSLPMETDAELHIFRLHELGLLVRGGDYYPRWAPNFYHGYGYPIFNYYAPLTYYVGLLFEVWSPFDAVAAVKAVFIIGLLAAALGMYGFVRDNWGRSAGFVAAAVYIYAPYVQYVDPHARGVMPESFSLGLFPLVLWALDSVRRGGGAWVWLTAVWLTAAVILTHNLMALLFFGLLLAWVIWQLLMGEGRFGTGATAGRVPHLFAALGLGLGVAAFFWLPVYLERNAVTLHTLIGQNDNYDFHTHFLSLAEMLAWSPWLDWGASEPAFRFNLGVAQWLLGGAGIVLWLGRRVRHGRQVAFFALALAALLFLMLPISTPVWEALPFMPFFQFPWRLLGPAAAMCAVLAGAGTEALITILPPRHVGTWVTAVFVAFTLLLSLPMSQPAPWGDFGEVNTLRMTLIENTGRWLGTTSTADYVPATVDTVPARKGSVVGPVAEGKPMDRVNYETLPAEVTIQTEVIRPLHTRYLMTTPRFKRLRLYLFDFPGWQVHIDGQVVETELGRPDGFIVIPVPAGQHVIDVAFGTTPARTAAAVVTAGSLMVAIGAALVRWRRQRMAPAVQPLTFPPALSRPDGWTLGAALWVTAVAILLLEPAGVLHDSSSGFVAEPAQTDIWADFGEQIALIGYTAPRVTAVPGDAIPLTLYWKAQHEMTINFQAFVHVLALDGTLMTQSHKLNPGDFPTKWWPLDKYVLDAHTLLLPADMPPGEYAVTAGLWVQSEGWRLPLLEDGGQVGDNVTLFRLIVEAK